jgi:hypothetical protein
MIMWKNTVEPGEGGGGAQKKVWPMSILDNYGNVHSHNIKCLLLLHCNNG